MKSYKHKTNSSPPLWRNRNYLLLQGGQVVSSIGDQQQFIALPLLILALTGSAVQAGISLSFNNIPVFLCCPISGVCPSQLSWKGVGVILCCALVSLLMTMSILL